MSCEREEEEEVEVGVVDEEESSLSWGAERAVGNSVARARAKVGSRVVIVIACEKRGVGSPCIGGGESILVDLLEVKRGVILDFIRPKLCFSFFSSASFAIETEALQFWRLCTSSPFSSLVLRAPMFDDGDDDLVR